MLEFLGLYDHILLFCTLLFESENELVAIRKGLKESVGRSR
jgi:hypothetical protein